MLKYNAQKPVLPYFTLPASVVCFLFQQPLFVVAVVLGRRVFYLGCALATGIGTLLSIRSRSFRLFHLRLRRTFWVRNMVAVAARLGEQQPAAQQHEQYQPETFYWPSREKHRQQVDAMRIEPCPEIKPITLL